MEINKRNKKIAQSRWKKIHDRERSILNQNSHKYFLKARLCGFLAGDGSIMIRKDNQGKMHYVLRFFPDHVSLIKPFTESLFGLYNKTPIIKKNFSHNGLICYSKIIVEDLLQTSSFGIYDWRAPLHILNNKKNKVEWLRAFFDSEGYVGKKHIKIQTVNKKGMDDVERLLSELKIRTRRYVYKSTNKNFHDVHIIIIGKRSEQLKFLNIIGFNHKVKLARLNKMLESPNLVWHRGR
jgi:hypothetical protein